MAKCLTFWLLIGLLFMLKTVASPVLPDAEIPIDIDNEPEFRHLVVRQVTIGDITISTILTFIDMMVKGFKIFTGFIMPNSFVDTLTKCVSEITSIFRAQSQKQSLLSYVTTLFANCPTGAQLATGLKMDPQLPYASYKSYATPVTNAGINSGNPGGLAGAGPLTGGFQNPNIPNPLIAPTGSNPFYDPYYSGSGYNPGGFYNPPGGIYPGSPFSNPQATVKPPSGGSLPGGSLPSGFNPGGIYNPPGGFYNPPGGIYPGSPFNNPQATVKPPSGGSLPGSSLPSGFNPGGVYNPPGGFYNPTGGFYPYGGYYPGGYPGYPYGNPQVTVKPPSGGSLPGGSLLSGSNPGGVYPPPGGPYYPPDSFYPDGGYYPGGPYPPYGFGAFDYYG